MHIMKFLNKIWRIGLLALLLVMAAPNKSSAQNDYISDQDFYDSLSPYGIWVYDPQYGDVWVPDVQGDFRPYATDGHWVLTEYGNTWVSDYPWGWATFHYGRWRFDDYYGWEWIPGYDWAPAWVSWRQGGGYYGWAPLLPGIDISLSIGGGYNIPNDYWVFAPQAYITSPNIYNYYVPRTRVVNIMHNATIINNVYTHDNHRYIAGPRVQDIQRVTHRSPEIYRINNSNRPGPVNISNKTVNIYRPAVRRAPDARPERVVDANAYKQQNPNQGIARREPGGTAGYNRANASKLAEVARSSNPNNNVVHVNNRPNNNQSGNRFGNRNDQNRPGQNNVQPGNASGNNQPGNRFGNRPDQNNAQPGNAPDNNQPNNRVGQPGNRGGFRGRPEDRPNIAPQNNAQPATPAQPGTRSDNGRRRDQNGAPFNRQQQNDAAQQQAQQQQQQDARRQQMQQQQDAQRQQQQDARRQQMQQQQDAQRQQQQDARRQQMQQQQDAQRQQQQDARRQQMQQQRQQQQDAQRQQQMQQQRQQQDAQRQQQDAQRQQQQQQEQQQRQARPAREAQPQ